MEIFVYADWIELGGAKLIGVLSVGHTRGREIFSFNYDPQWLANRTATYLDPDLKFFAGKQYPASSKKNFGIFMDSSPDRWGRVLMGRREAILAKTESRKPKTLMEEDYLMGVHDEYRMGALRFKLTPEGPFLDDHSELASPPWTSLRELEYASLQLEKESVTDKNALKWLNMLMAPGASLGGARPKASVLDPHKNLWIAKFPSNNDEVDIGAWEMVVNTMARNCGLKVAEAEVKKFNSQHHTYITKRFDRVNIGKRIHFASAMTLLGYSDGAESVSYIELGEFIMQHGANVIQDLQELWKRIVFYISVKNTDDHLRNHGFLFTHQGWELSPAYDINPVYFGTGLSLNINEMDNSLDLDLARSVAKYFRVSLQDSDTFILKVKQVTNKWRKLASSYNIPKKDQDLISSAFE